MAPWCTPGLHYLPLALITLVPITFICTYTVSVLLHHVEPDFPYISDTGTTPPESCIFSQLLNFCAILIFLNVYVRYLQLAHHTEVGRYNRATLVLGTISALGISIVANFQETLITAVHLTGAVLGFGVGNIYCWVQSLLSYRLAPYLNTRRMAHLRTALSATTALTFVSTYACDALSKRRFHGDSPRHWGKDDGGYVLHVISAASEWLMAVAQLGFFMTFVQEFKQYSISSPEVLPLVSGKRSLLSSENFSEIDPESADVIIPSNTTS